MQNDRKDIIKKASFNCLKSWGEAVSINNKQGVLNCYDDQASLCPTMSPKLRVNISEISLYFDSFLKKVRGQVVWEDVIFQLVNEMACIWTGIYTFQLESGRTKARFSFFLINTLGAWKIYHHHSSVLPD